MVSMPGLIPVTIPPVVMVAPGLLLPHAPPPAVSVSVIREPTHTLEGPEITPAPKAVTTVTTRVAVAVPQLFVTI